MHLPLTSHLVDDQKLRIRFLQVERMCDKRRNNILSSIY
jgi:hypothetical protein